MAKGRTPAKTQGTALVKQDFSGYEGQGFENQTQDDIALPFISILEDLSPQVKKKTVKGAKVGMLINTVTDELYDEILFCCGVTQHVFVEWRPRKEGGGFVGIHATTSPAVQKAKSESDKFGSYSIGKNDLVETYYQWGVQCDEREPITAACIAYTKTRIKGYRRFNTRLSSFMVRTPKGKDRPPLCSHIFRVGTKEETNPEGTFHVFDLTPAKGDVAGSRVGKDDPRFQAAHDVYEQIKAGTMRAAYESLKPEEGAELPF